ncbi:MAG: acyl-CoA dehydrogenase family protein [Bdellovibrionota bacterium]
MHFELSKEHQLLRETTRKFVQSELVPLSLQIEETKKIPESAIQKVREMGYCGITIPEEYGGMGMDTVSHLIIQEELGWAHDCFNYLISGNNGIGAMGIVYEGTETQKKKYLPELASGKKLAAFALTEPNAGSDAQSIETTATKKGDQWVLNGRKHFITRAEMSDVFTVMAANDRSKKAKGGITAFIVERGMPGFTVGRHQPSMGSDVVKQCELIFEDCLVPAANVIGEVGQGFRIAMKVLNSGRLSLAARALGQMKYCQDKAVEYAKQRVQFGEPIANKQLIQAMIADNEVDIFSVESMLYPSAWRKDQGKNVNRECAICKLYASEALARVADRSIQIHGGMGYMVETGIERVYRDARAMRLYEGTSEIQRTIIARAAIEEGRNW